MHKYSCVIVRCKKCFSCLSIIMCAHSNASIVHQKKWVNQMIHYKRSNIYIQMASKLKGVNHRHMQRSKLWQLFTENIFEMEYWTQVSVHKHAWHIMLAYSWLLLILHFWDAILWWYLGNQNWRKCDCQSFGSDSKSNIAYTSRRHPTKQHVIIFFICWKSTDKIRLI